MQHMEHPPGEIHTEALPDKVHGASTISEPQLGQGAASGAQIRQSCSLSQHKSLFFQVGYGIASVEGTGVGNGLLGEGHSEFGNVSYVPAAGHTPQGTTRDDAIEVPVVKMHVDAPQEPITGRSGEPGVVPTMGTCEKGMRDDDSDWEEYAQELGFVSIDEDTSDGWCCDHGKSLFIFEQDHPLRALCLTAVADKRFDRVILVFIFASSITMAIERPAIEDGSAERWVLNGLNYLWTSVFVIEMLIKVVAWGFFFGPRPTYLRDSWNKLDGLLVFISLIDIIFTIAGAEAGGLLRILRIARILRTLRPLRLISRAPKLKLVVRTLMTSLETIGNTVTIVSVIFLIFAILGIQLFAGKFRYCVDSTGQRNESVTNLLGCSNSGGKIINPTLNFDNLLASFLTLFYVASLDGWVAVMYNGIDAVGIDENMQTNHSKVVALFFVAFLLIGNFFVLNLFIGVIVDSFQRALEPDFGGSAEEESAAAAQQRAQEEAAALRVMDEAAAADISYTEAYGWQRMWMWRIATHTLFELFITVVITMNVAMMAVEHYDQSEIVTVVLRIFNIVFTGIFTIELIIKVIAFGFRRYISDGWNKFDAFIVVVSYLGLILDLVSSDSPINPSMLRIMRVFRIARILKLLKAAQGVRALLDTVFKSFGQILNIGILLLLFFFIYAAAGVELFGTIGCVRSSCEAFNELANFSNFGMALLTLFRVCTGDEGVGFLSDAMRVSPDCDDSNDCKSDCCANKYLAPIYFASFTIFAQFVLLNIVVALLMSQLEESQAQNDDQFQKGLEIEAKARAEGREVIRSESVQALIKLREGRLQNPRSQNPDPQEQNEKEMHTAECVVVENDESGSSDSSKKKIGPTDARRASVIMKHEAARQQVHEKAKRRLSVKHGSRRRVSQKDERLQKQLWQDEMRWLGTAATEQGIESVQQTAANNEPVGEPTQRHIERDQSQITLK